MKTKNFRYFLVTLICVFFTFNIQAQKEALTYLEQINKELDAIMTDTWDYISAVSHGKNARKVDNKRKELIKTSLQAKQRVENMKDFNGSAQLRDSVAAYLQLNYIVLNEDYEKIVDMEEIAEQSYDLMEAYLMAQDKANDKLNTAGDMMENQQRVFAAANNITLIDNPDKVAKKLKAAGEVFDYYNVVYLIFFKSYKQEIYLIDAMNRGDVNAMEQNKNALIETSKEGLDKLTVVKSFKGDNSVVTACKDMLNFYKNEAEKDMAGIIDFYMKKENFDKIRTSFEALSKSQQTKPEVDKYNNAVKEFNTATGKYNETNNTLNTNRTKLLDKWNNTSETFKDKHVPKYKK